MSTTTPVPASTKQIGFLTKLINERITDQHLKAAYEQQLENGPSKTEAAALIKSLLSLPAPQQAAAVTEKGVYQHDGVVYVVKPNKAGDRLYAKRLVETGERITEAGTIVTIDFEYERGAIYKISAADKLPAEQAKELSIRYGKCIVCGRKLKAAKSVEAGIGPICQGYFA